MKYALIVLVATLVLLTSAFAQRKTTVRWLDGGFTTVWGPVSPAPDGGIYTLR